MRDKFALTYDCEAASKRAHVSDAFLPKSPADRRPDPPPIHSQTLGFKSLPLLYWPIILSYLVAYGILTHLVKVWFFRRYGS